LLARLLCVTADVETPRTHAKPAEAAWEAVYERVRPSLVRALAAATGSYDGVEDAIQDAFGEALRRSPSELADVEGWLFSAALDRLRGHQRRARILRRLGLMAAPRDSELDEALQHAEIRRVLDPLTPRERELLIAKGYVARTQDEDIRPTVASLDALPVPDEPTGFGAVARPSLGRDPRMLLVAALLLALVTTVTSQQFQHSAADVRKYVERIAFGQGWVGYYIEGATRPSASSQPSYRLMFASSDSPRSPTTLDLVGGRPDHGQWSPDRERIAVSNGGQLYVGDRSGRLQQVADVGAGFVIASGWIRNDKIWAIALMPGDPAVADSAFPPPYLFVAVDLKTGALERRILDDVRGAVAGAISPDGRWLALVGNDGACRNYAAFYDLATRATIGVVDGNGLPASLSGFLSDGRIVVTQCDRFAHTMELYVGAPGARPSLIAVVPTTLRYPLVASGNGSDEIFVIASAPDAPQSAYVFDPTGRLLRRVALPQFGAQGTTDVFGEISHDGKSLGFTISELHRDPFPDFVPRAGVLDLVTGQVTYLCDSGCFWLLVR
jgi:DNA-directed RNA polymerase specialized sigma24 family protein